MIILYDDRCSPCVRKPLWKALRAFAADKRILIVRKDVIKDKEAQTEAESHGISVPFVVYENKATSLKEFLHG